MKKCKDKSVKNGWVIPMLYYLTVQNNEKVDLSTNRDNKEKNENKI